MVRLQRPVRARAYGVARANDSRDTAAHATEFHKIIANFAPEFYFFFFALQLYALKTCVNGAPPLSEAAAAGFRPVAP